MTSAPSTILPGPPEPDAVTGVQLMQGIGVSQARGFWADAWAHIVRRPGVVAAMAWLGIVAFFAVFAPVIASGHPLVLRQLDSAGRVADVSYPLFRNLAPADIGVMLGTVMGTLFIFFWPAGTRAARVGLVIWGAVLAGIIVVGVGMFRAQLSPRDLPQWLQAIKRRPSLWIEAPLAFGALELVVGLGVARYLRSPRHAVMAVAALVLGAASVTLGWNKPELEPFDYRAREAAGEVRAVYTLVPWSPNQRDSALNRKPPMTTLGEGLGLPAGAPGADRVFILGTDALGQDVLSQLLSACRLAISIGLVSTGIAVVIGVTIGALMGYFGGWVDLVLFRVVEIFMAVPLLFLLILAAAVLPPEMRSTYVMMAIIGCFTWTGAARYTRAEFLKLRSQDFVQSAKAVGLPLRSILFKHMLPNGVTPVLVDASFSIAAAITIEATLSYLGLGPVDQASWGKVLSYATNPEGEFKWWLAIFPGFAIFLTVLSYNMIGEALRDAIDPKLKKARV
jgi:peptide/nickel transport system permease protein